MIYVLGLLVAAGAAGALWLLPAFRFLRSFEQTLNKSATGVQRTTRSLPDLTFHVYAPTQPPDATLIVVPGLHPDGIHDKRFIAFAQSCAQAGFQVIAPDLLEFRQFRISEKTTQSLRALLNSLREQLPAGSVDRIGMVGISYGAGPVFLLAAERKIDLVVSIGGYYNLLHALEFSFSGAHPEGEQRKAHEWGRLIFALNHIDDIATPIDRETLEKSLSLRLALKVQEAEVLEKELSPDGKQLLKGIQEGLSPQQKNTFLDTAYKRKEEARALSPESVLSTVDRSTKIYLLHGTQDDSIPFEETEELHNHLQRLGFRPHTLITPALTHVDYTNVSDILEFLKLLHWQRMLLLER